VLLWVDQTTPLATSSKAVRNGFLESSSGRNLPFDGGASVAVEKVSRERYAPTCRFFPIETIGFCAQRGQFTPQNSRRAIHSEAVLGHFPLDFRDDGWNLRGGGKRCVS
jgi:hypothetical protein